MSVHDAKPELGGKGTARSTVTFRWRVTDEVYRSWHALRLLYQRSNEWQGSYVEVLCVAVWSAWRYTLGADVAYAEVYERDRYQCTSPVCFHQRVTPHHVVFRSAGGSDECENVTAASLWCHLEGIHGGRLKVSGIAPDELRWTLGRKPIMEVVGRRRVQAGVGS